MDVRFTQYVDLAQVALYAFWIFFVALILYIRRTDKQEGYPLVTREGRRLDGFPRKLPSKHYVSYRGDGESAD